MNRLFTSEQFDPTLNLAVEEAMLLGGGAPALFLWQNAHTVVIGCSQNAWKECRVELLRQEEGTLVRRTTGGGAVYHDLGNLNFSFVMPKELYDVPRQLNVIRRAVAAFGIETGASGRNDIVIAQSGQKFSGNAFRITASHALHHGTILMDVDMPRLGRYLAPSPEKLRAKGVESVRARVGNLKELVPDMTISSLKQALFEAFIAEYGPAEALDWQTAYPVQEIAALTEKYRSWDWTYGKTPRFDITLNNRFAWGGVELLLSLHQGRVTQVECFTDAMDAALAQRVQKRLVGCTFEPGKMAQCLLAEPAAEDRELAEWLAQQQF